MAVTINDIKKLREMTGAGMMDCKNALIETDGDIQGAIEIIRKKGQAVAAKREDRQASEGCVLAGTNGTFAAIVALKCETDFVAKNEQFRQLTKDILACSLAAQPKTMDELKGAKLTDGRTVQEHITDLIGTTGEKMEMGAYEWLNAPSVSSYEHLGNKLATIVGLNQEGIDNTVGREVGMQVAAMNPVSPTRESVPQNVIDEEIKVAEEKTRLEQIQKAVESAIKKAGYNVYTAASEEHITEGIMKGYITEEDAVKIREIKETAAKQKEANMPEQMIKNIAQGRLNKFFKESVLMEQEYHRDAKISVGEYLASVAKGLSVVDFKRVNLNQD